MEGTRSPAEHLTTPSAGHRTTETLTCGREADENTLITPPKKLNICLPYILDTLPCNACPKEMFSLFRLVSYRQKLSLPHILYGGETSIKAPLGPLAGASPFLRNGTFSVPLVEGRVAP